MKKKVIIFGGTKGIGYEIFKELKQKKFDVYAVSRKKNFLKKNDLKFYFQCDVMDEVSVRKLLNKFKKNKLNFNVIIHCIGGSFKSKNNINDEKDFYLNWKLNFSHFIEINNYFISKMKKSKWGRILHFSSAGTLSHKTPLAYSTAKAALNSYIINYGKQLVKYNVVLTAISPGPINLEKRFLPMQAKNNTKFWKNFSKDHLPSKRLVKPIEILPLVNYLISDNASYCGSNIFNIDGGYY